jgi:hypothetical protein
MHPHLALANQMCSANLVVLLFVSTGHNLSQGPLRSMFTAGITWALEEPAARAAFLQTCLGPFTAKLAAAEAGQVAGQLQQQLPAAEAALLQGDEAAAAAEEDEEAVEELRGFLKALQVRVCVSMFSQQLLCCSGNGWLAAAGPLVCRHLDVFCVCRRQTGSSAASLRVSDVALGFFLMIVCSLYAAGCGACSASVSGTAWQAHICVSSNPYTTVAAPAAACCCCCCCWLCRTVLLAGRPRVVC